MKVDILEFKLNNTLFGIKTEYIKNVFDIENVIPLPLMPNYVAGIAKYGENVYILICLEQLLGISNDDCKNFIGKSAITIYIKDHLYSFVVDEIIKIEELETNNTKEELVNLYNLDGKILEVITPEFLSLKIDVPSLKRKSFIDSSNELNIAKEDEVNYLIFLLRDKKFGINTEFIKKIEHIDVVKDYIHLHQSDWIEGVFFVKDRAIKVGNLKKLLSIPFDEIGSTVIILEKDNKYFGFIVDEILDIVNIKVSLINEDTNKNCKLDKFFLYKNSIVSILSESFIKDSIDKYSLTQKEGAPLERMFSISNSLKVSHFIIINILGDFFALSMENVEEVFNSEDVHISSYISENPLIAGLITLKDESIFLVNLESIFKKNFKKDEDSKIIVLNQDNLRVAILVNDIESIVSVNEENISIFEDTNQIVGGTIFVGNDEIINLFSVDWLKKELINGEFVK